MMHQCLIGSVLFWLLVATGVAVAQVPQSQPAGTPEMELSATSFEFGEVWQGEPVSKEILIKNIGTAPLTISVKTSCGCTAPTKPKSPLPPGEADTMTITYDTLKRQGAARQTITLLTNDPAQPRVPIEVTGNVKPLYEVKPNGGIGFYRLHRSAEESKTIVFKSKYDGPVHFRLKEGQDFGVFAVELKETKPGMEFELTARTKPPMKQGYNAIEVEVETGLDHSPMFRVPIQAYVRPDVECSPSTLPLSRQAMYPMPKRVKVTSREDMPVKVLEARPSDPSIKCEIREPSSPRGGWVDQTVQITLPPGAELPPGDAWVTLRTDARDEQYRELTIRIQVVEPVKKPAAQPEEGPQSP
ncbi:MAG: DUF1573 domain-containing protein [Phycisphaerae bacterium]|jgi:hypothetical protein